MYTKQIDTRTDFKVVIKTLDHRKSSGQMSLMLILAIIIANILSWLLYN